MLVKRRRNDGVFIRVTGFWKMAGIGSGKTFLPGVGIAHQGLYR